MTAISVYRSQPLSYVQFTSLGSAITLGVDTPSTGAAAFPAGVRHATIYVEGAGIRWRDDGTAPTASIGMPVAAGAAFDYTGTLTSLKIIQQSGGAIINITYYA